jgi:hypothetical protein
MSISDIFRYGKFTKKIIEKEKEELEKAKKVKKK